jgi:pilus assembly protein CpaF
MEPAHFHADCPREAARRLVTVMGADAEAKPHEANQIISDAVDLVMQIDIRHEVRRVVAISTMSKDLKNRGVFFEPIYRYMEESLAANPCCENFIRRSSQIKCKFNACQQNNVVR